MSAARRRASSHAGSADAAANSSAITNSFGKYGKRSATGPRRQMHQPQIEKAERRQEHSRREARNAASSRQHREERALPARRLTRNHLRWRSWKRCRSCSVDCGDEPRVQQPVCHIEEPCAHRQSGGKPWRKPETGRAPEGPAPQARLPWVHPDSEGANTAAMCEGSGANSQCSGSSACVRSLYGWAATLSSAG